MVRLTHLATLAATTAISFALGCANMDSGSSGSGPGSVGGKGDGPLAEGPMYLTGAFDGSKAFRMWHDTMAFAREIEREYGKPLHFTYFINSTYYDPTVTGSWIGRAQSRQEAIVRFALTQQAINEGHEIADHTVRHRDGSQWSEDQWRTELGEFNQLVENNLFETLVGADGKPVFPRWRAMPSAGPGETGASCNAAADCDSGMCMELAPGQSFCTAGCNKNNPCANGTVCGAPDWNSDQDRCILMPEFPVVHDGEVLFDEAGVPNLQSSQLVPYDIVGFRAPQLGHNQALYEVLEELGYRYDTSKILGMGPPSRNHSGRLFESIYQFALMRGPGAATVPMDYNYRFGDISGERMLEDYKRAIVESYARGRQPWNIGHHFSLWKGGAYWEAMKDAFRFAAEGCPSNAGSLQCGEIEFPSFVELADTLDELSGKSDAGDLFAEPGVEEDDTHIGEGGCEGHDLEGDE